MRARRLFSIIGLFVCKKRKKEVSSMSILLDKKVTWWIAMYILKVINIEEAQKIILDHRRRFKSLTFELLSFLSLGA